MSEARLSQWRQLVRARELPPDLVAELRSVVASLVRRRRLPPSFTPYGQWNDEAADEIFQSWYAERLLGQGHLLMLLDRARTPGGFRALAERSLRHHLINSKDRSQADNLYRRVVAVMTEGSAFRLVQDAPRPQDRWYAFVDQPVDIAKWAGDDRLLVAHAWALGDFVVVRYKAAAVKLSPVLEVSELERFTQGLLQRTGTALTPGLVMRALAARFDLGEVEFVSNEEAAAVATSARLTDEAVILDYLARSLLDQMSARQLEILRRSESETVAEIATIVGCSVGTVVNQQRRVGELFERMTESDEERDQVLNIVVDLAYRDNDE